MSEFDYIYNVVKCSKCGRSILIERLFRGIDHTTSTLVTCKECLRKALPLPKDFVKKHPKEAKQIMKWLEEGDK